MLFAIAAPANNERGPRYMEKSLAAVHQANRKGHPITFEYGSRRGMVGLFIRIPAELQGTVIGPISASYPNCAITNVEEDNGREGAGLRTWRVDLDLTPELFPILRHAQFEDLLNGSFADPIDGVLRAIKPDETLVCRIDITVAPASRRRCRGATRAIKRLDRPFFRTHSRLAAFYARHITQRFTWIPAWCVGLLAARSEYPVRSSMEVSASRHHDREEDLQAASDKLGGHLFEVHMRLMVFAPAKDDDLALDRLRTMAGAFGSFTRSRLATFRTSKIRRGTVPLSRGRAFLLSHEELSTLFHPPTATVAAERMQLSEFTELEAPAALPAVTEEGSVQLGRVQYRDDNRIFGLALEDRRRHLYIIGKTGMGKSALLQNMLASDMRRGLGVCLVDPHGDLAASLLGLVPAHRTNDVIYFDAADREYVVPFNPLACRDPTLIDQVTSGVVSAFKKLHDSWGPRLEDTLRNAVFATVEQQGTMHTLLRLLADKTYREGVVPHIRDDIVRSFWQHEFARWHDAYRTEAVAAIQNKIRPFLTNTHMRAIVTQSGRSLDLRQIMDEGKILIVNLSKGRVGEDNATLLGAFLVTSIQQAAMTRADVPEDQRRDFFLYVDEFQNFTTGGFASVLSEARKFRLSLTVAHQYVGQLNEQTASAVWGNVGSMIAFQIGSDDAEVLAQQLSKYRGQLQSQEFTSLPKYTAYARLLIDGMPSNPFSMKTLAPTDIDESRRDAVCRMSRRQFAQPLSSLHR